MKMGTTFQKVWNKAKTGLSGRCIAISAYCLKNTTDFKIT